MTTMKMKLAQTQARTEMGSQGAWEEQQYSPKPGLQVCEEKHDRFCAKQRR